MKSGTKKLIAAMMAVSLAVGGAGTVLAAPGSIDSTPPSDTETVVYMQDGKTVQTNYTANGSIAYALPVLNATGASADDLAMNVTHDGVEYYSFTGTWDSYNSGETDTSTDYIHNVSGDELADVPMNINQNVTLNVTYWNTSADNPTPTTIQVYVENSDERSIQRVTESSASADVETLEQPFYRGADEYSAASVDDTVKVNGSETTVTYYLAGSNVSTPFGNQTEDAETAEFSLMMADVDADSASPVPVFVRSAPDWYDSEDMGTYAVYNPSENTMTFHSGSEFESANQADIQFTSDVYRSTDAWTVWKLAGGASGSGPSAIMDMVM